MTSMGLIKHLCAVRPAVDDGIIRLGDGELQLLHVGPAQTNSAALAGQRHQHQTGFLSARHHVAVVCDHHPVSGITIINKAMGAPASSAPFGISG